MKRQALYSPIWQSLGSVSTHLHDVSNHDRKVTITTQFHYPKRGKRETPHNLYGMKTSILIISAGALWLHSPGAWGQRIRLQESTDPISTDGQSQIAENLSLPEEAMIEDAEEGSPDVTEQVAINRTDTNPANPATEQPAPISAILFDGSPGPKACRGTAVLTIKLSKPGAQHLRPTCYNVPGPGGGGGVAQCGNFVANKDDGCEARVFAEPDCRTFANLAVFIPETRAFGGYMRSVEVRCGVVGEAPPPLNLPGLKLPPGAVQAVG
ncbi:hypothetical protein F4859DRAFT_497172 [Xylaria cf. heliscus]|nr:hypothetical protein F4859DRAFT_497172 [Xylaria cf. heliscus]